MRTPFPMILLLVMIQKHCKSRYLFLTKPVIIRAERFFCLRRMILCWEFPRSIWVNTSEAIRKSITMLFQKNEWHWKLKSWKMKLEQTNRRTNRSQHCHASIGSWTFNNISKKEKWDWKGNQRDEFELAEL